jgi:hypothetical protein
VYVIGHQHVRVDRHVVCARRVAQAIEIEPIFAGVREHRCAVIAALNDVQDSARVVETRLAWHITSVRSNGTRSPSSKSRL